MHLPGYDNRIFPGDGNTINRLRAYAAYFHNLNGGSAADLIFSIILHTVDHGKNDNERCNTNGNANYRKQRVEKVCPNVFEGIKDRGIKGFQHGRKTSV